MHEKLIISATLLCFFSCNEDDNCDIGTIDENAVCIEVYDPVCGCNNVTYSNDCHAAAMEFQIGQRGECLN